MFETESNERRMESPLKIANADLTTARKLKFYFIKVLGHNGNRSNSFSKAQCMLKAVGEEQVYFFHMDSLFKRGFDLLDGNCRIVGESFLKANRILHTYLDDLENQKLCLLRVLNDKNSTETEIAVALVEHLLVKLSSSQVCILDKNVSVKEGCKCRCGQKSTFGSTGIGHEKVWHGFLDVIFPSCEENLAGVVITRTWTELYSEDSYIVDKTQIAIPSKRQKLEESEKDSQERVSLMKGKLDVQYNCEDTEDQTLSQTIVLGHLQKIRHPECSNFLVPNILISSQSFRIIMYDAKNDFLIQSYDFKWQKHFGASVVILWMVLHHQTLCNGIDIESLQQKINVADVRSEFPNQISEASKSIYNCDLKLCVSSFPVVKRHCLPDADDLLFGEHLEL